MSAQRLRAPLTIAVAAVLAPSVASAANHLVDPSGASSPYTTIEQAMAAAAPGDSILLLPGQYPAFLFHKGVSVLGLGQSPSDVTIARVDFHPTNPWVGYDALLSNVAVCGSGPGDAISITGNELGPGTLTLNGVSTCGGVFLHGGTTGFYAIVENCRFEPGPGGGFGNAAFDFGGGANVLDVGHTTIAGWDATDFGVAAGAGLRIAGGSDVKLTDSLILGGAGVDEDPLLATGAAAIASGLGSLPSTLRLDGGTLVQGGAGDGGAGGAGVSFTGTIELGAATVAGGAGTPAGSAYSDAQPVPTPFELELDMQPVLRDASAPAFLMPGDSFTWSMRGDQGVPAVVAVGFAIDLAGPLYASPLETTGPMLFFGDTASFQIPDLGPSVYLPGVQVYGQGFLIEPGFVVHETNPVTVRVDL